MHLVSIKSGCDLDRKNYQLAKDRLVKLCWQLHLVLDG
jgi:hypothetical protein